MQTRTARQILNALATLVIADHRDLWGELKEEIVENQLPHLYGSPIGLQFQSAAMQAIRGLDDSERSSLTNHAEKYFLPSEKDRCPSRLVVAEIMTRAARVVSRNGGDSW